MADASAPAPTAVAKLAVASASFPTATDRVPVACAPNASPSDPVSPPMAKDEIPVASDCVPIEILFAVSAFAPCPIETAPVPPI